MRLGHAEAVQVHEVVDEIALGPAERLVLLVAVLQLARKLLVTELLERLIVSVLARHVDAHLGILEAVDLRNHDAQADRQQAQSHEGDADVHRAEEAPHRFAL